MKVSRKIFFLTAIFLIICFGFAVGKEASADTIGNREDIIRLIEESTRVAQAASESAGLPDFQPGAVVTTDGIQITQKGRDILRPQQPLAAAVSIEKKAVSKDESQDLSQKLGSISDILKSDILKEEEQAGAVSAPVIEDKGNDKGILNNLLAISILGLSGKRSWSLVIGLVLIVAAIFITMPRKKKIDMQASANKALQSKIIDNKVMIKK